MKTIIKLFVLIATSILVVSCAKQDSTMRTLVRADGSCNRTIEIQTDTARLVNGWPDYDRLPSRAEKGNHIRYIQDKLHGQDSYSILKRKAYENHH